MVHPPDENVTTSLPNFDFLFERETRDSVINFVSDLNYSCPDLNFNGGLLVQNKRPEMLRKNSWSETESNASKPKPSKSYISELGELQSSISDTEICVYCKKLLEMCACQKPSFKAPKWTAMGKSKKARRKSEIKTAEAKPRRRKTDITPTEILKYKLKQSLSLHNLHASPSGHEYNYHTIHTSTDIPQNITEFKFYDYKAEKKSNSFETIKESVSSLGSIDPNYPSQFENSLDGIINKNTNTQANTILKCCCGGARCGSVVPISVYLETYYNKTVRTLIWGIYFGVGGGVSLLALTVVRLKLAFCVCLFVCALLYNSY